MRLKNIEERVDRLTTLINGWTKQGSVPRIERDMALDELRRLYDALLDIENVSGAEPSAKEQEEEAEPEHVAVPQAPAVVVATVEPKEEVVTVADPVADFDDALDIDALLGLSEEASPEPVAAPQPEPTSVAEPEPTSEPTSEPTPVAEPEPVAEPKVVRGGGLFDIEDIPVRQKSSRKMISLYSAPTTATPVEVESKVKVAAPAPQPMPQVVSAPAEPQRIGDVLGSGRKVVGDVAGMESVPTPPMSKITDLRKAIGLNDKFLMLRDLFAGNEAQYNETIDALNSFNDLDECMIYIVENFAWNPDSEGAKLIVSLIERKLS